MMARSSLQAFPQICKNQRWAGSQAEVQTEEPSSCPPLSNHRKQHLFTRGHRRVLSLIPQVGSENQSCSKWPPQWVKNKACGPLVGHRLLCRCSVGTAAQNTGPFPSQQAESCPILRTVVCPFPCLCRVAQLQNQGVICPAAGSITRGDIKSQRLKKILWPEAFSCGGVFCLIQVWLGSLLSVPNFADSEDEPVRVRIAPCDQQDGLAGTLLALHTWQPQLNS